MIEVYHIEDDKAIAYAVKEYLEQHNCRVSVFTTKMCIRDRRKSTWI